MKKTGRPPAFDRAEVIDAAMQLFWEKGFEGTSKRDIMEATGLASQSLYNAFGDKHALFLACIRHYVETRINLMLDVLHGPDTPLENLRNVVRMWGSVADDSEFRNGCFLCTSASEFAHEKGEIADFLREQSVKIRAAFTEVLEAARSNGELTTTLPSETLASALLCTSNGIAMMTRTGASEAMRAEAAEAILRLLE